MEPYLSNVILVENRFVICRVNPKTRKQEARNKLPTPPNTQGHEHSYHALLRLVKKKAPSLSFQKTYKFRNNNGRCWTTSTYYLAQVLARTTRLHWCARGGKGGGGCGSCASPKRSCNWEREEGGTCKSMRLHALCVRGRWHTARMQSTSTGPAVKRHCWNGRWQPVPPSFPSPLPFPCLLKIPYRALYKNGSLLTFRKQTNRRLKPSRMQRRQQHRQRRQRRRQEQKKMLQQEMG